MGKVQTVYVVTMLLLASLSGAGLGSVSAAGNVDGGAGNSFGQLVSNFVHDLQSSGNTNGGFGFEVATFVLSNNPAAAMIPDHAGPPADREPGPPAAVGAGTAAVGPPTDAGPPATDERGPPAAAAGNQVGATERGPPSDAGPPDEADDRGPPSDAGPPGETDAEETPTATETDDDAGTSSGGGSTNNGGGPSDDRGGLPEDSGPPE